MDRAEGALRVAELALAEARRVAQSLADFMATARDGERGADGERGPEGPPGKFAAPKAWLEGLVYYEGDLVVSEGSTWCARHDTAARPPHDAWAPVAMKGADAAALEYRGVFSGVQVYRAMNLVAKDGGMWLALRDDPGAPGDSDGWLLQAQRGKPGKPGERGPPGERGKDGIPGEPLTIIAWKRDGYVAVPIMADGSEGGALDLREFFEDYHAEVRS